MYVSTPHVLPSHTSEKVKGTTRSRAVSEQKITRFKESLSQVTCNWSDVLDTNDVDCAYEKFIDTSAVTKRLTVRYPTADGGFRFQLDGFVFPFFLFFFCFFL